MIRKKLVTGFIVAMILVVAIVAYVQAQGDDGDNGILESVASGSTVQDPPVAPAQGDFAGNGISESVASGGTVQGPVVAPAQGDFAGNGISESVASGDTVQGPVVVDGMWYEWAQVSGVVSGCSPADPAGPVCTPSSGSNSVFADAPPWTFTAPADGVTLSVTDAFSNGDRFEVFDFGSSIGLTSVPSTSGICGDDPVPCMADPNASSSTFSLGPGPHAITIGMVDNPIGSGAAYFRVDSGSVVLDGLWYEWAQVSGVVSGCSPADPAGPVCTPSSGGNSVFVHAPPWNFTAPAGGATISVTDAFLVGDRFEVFDFGSSIGLTSVPSTSGSCGDDPVPCMADPNASSGTFFLGPGAHSITFGVVDNPNGSGAQYFRVDSGNAVFLPFLSRLSS